MTIPRGSTVFGVVERSQRSTGPDEQAILAIRFDRISVDGAEYPVSATVSDVEHSSGDSGTESAAKVGIGAAATPPWTRALS